MATTITASNRGDLSVERWKTVNSGPLSRRRLWSVPLPTKDGCWVTEIAVQWKESLAVVELHGITVNVVDSSSGKHMTA